ncbi:YecR family lipoprotein [Mangrovibacter sp. SLW1]
MRRIVIAVLCALVASCTITKTPEFVGGDRTSGVVRLAYDLPPLQNARVDQYMAQNNANRACQAWGTPRLSHLATPLPLVPQPVHQSA